MSGECGYDDPHDPHEYVVAQDGKPVDLPCPGVGDADEADGAYRERNAVVAALIRTNGWPTCVVPAPDEDGWWIVYAETPQGQVSWHFGPDDESFTGFPMRHAYSWDGHTTEEKYRRVAALAAAEATA